MLLKWLNVLWGYCWKLAAVCKTVFGTYSAMTNRYLTIEIENSMFTNFFQQLMQLVKIFMLVKMKSLKWMFLKCNLNCNIEIGGIKYLAGDIVDGKAKITISELPAVTMLLKYTAVVMINICQGKVYEFTKIEVFRISKKIYNRKILNWKEIDDELFFKILFHWTDPIAIFASSGYCERYAVSLKLYFLFHLKLITM